MSDTNDDVFQNNGTQVATNPDVINYTTNLTTTISGNTMTLKVNDSPSFAGTVTATGQHRSTTSTALATTGTVSLDPTLGQIFTVVPTGAITLNAASAAVGSLVYLVVTTSGVSSFTITPSTNFKSTGALATGTVSGKVFVIAFVGDGTNLNEIARTTAM